jgi:uncharacterized membrane protein
MTQEERVAWAGIISGLLFIAAYIWTLHGMTAAGIPDGNAALTAWARTMLLLIGAGVIAVIVVTILFTILHAIITRDPSPSFVVDERDRAISIWGMRVTLAVVSVVFIGGLVMLALGWSPFFALNLMFFGFSIGSLAGGVTQVVLYRRSG